MRGLRLDKSDRLLLAAVMLLAIVAAILAWRFAPPQRTGSFDDAPSTFYNDATGVKAAYIVLQRLGYRVDQLRRSVTAQRIDDADALVILTPRLVVTEDESNVLLEWVGRGGRLLVAPGHWFREWFEVMDDEARSKHESVDDERSALSKSHEAADAEPIAIKPLLKAASSDPLLTGVNSLELDDSESDRFNAERPVRGPLTDGETTVIWSDERGPTIIRIDYKRGQIVALTDTYVLSNLGLNDADNPHLTANLAAWLGGAEGQGMILFDEYHHGFMQRDVTPVAIAKLLIAGDRGWAAAQVVLIGVLALLAAAVRFGHPRRVAPVKRRRRGEYVDAAARLMDLARGSPVVAQRLLQHYTRGLARLVHASADDHVALASAVADRTGIDIEWSLSTLALKRSQRLTRTELLSAAKVLHRALSALEPVHESK